MVLTRGKVRVVERGVYNERRGWTRGWLEVRLIRTINHHQSQDGNDRWSYGFRLYHSKVVIRCIDKAVLIENVMFG